jgi:hypothetical protein
MSVLNRILLFWSKRKSTFFNLVDRVSPNNVDTIYKQEKIGQATNK